VAETLLEIKNQESRPQKKKENPSARVAQPSFVKTVGVGLNTKGKGNPEIEIRYDFASQDLNENGGAISRHVNGLNRGGGQQNSPSCQSQKGPNRGDIQKRAEG